LQLSLAGCKIPASEGGCDGWRLGFRGQGAAKREKAALGKKKEKRSAQRDRREKGERVIVLYCLLRLITSSSYI
jgi:hypothetical protein